MAKFACCYCGVERSNPSNGSSSCQHSPHKNHEFINAEGKQEFVCSYCGTKRSKISNGGASCSKSPHKTHKFI